MIATTPTKRLEYEMASPDARKNTFEFYKLKLAAAEVEKVQPKNLKLEKYLKLRTSRITDRKLRYHDKKVKTDALNSERNDEITSFFQLSEAQYVFHL